LDFYKTAILKVFKEYTILSIINFMISEFWGASWEINRAAIEEKASIQR
jgi:hypothetical protein